jgi:serine/threonine protein kinase
MNLIERSRTQLTENQIAYLLAGTLRALVYLHAKKIIHRDVKGNNILLTRTGQVKLADFGVSKRLQNHSSRMEEFGQIIGSPLWMAPESVQSKPADYKMDIWALGITAIEMAEGEPPRSDMSVFRVLRTIVQNEPPTLNEKMPLWSQTFKDFIAACLVKVMSPFFH